MNTKEIQHHMSDINNDPMLENNSYYDIDILNEANNPIQKKINYWKDRYNNASGNMGKWYCQIRIDRLRKKLHHYVDKK